MDADEHVIVEGESEEKEKEKEKEIEREKGSESTISIETMRDTFGWYLSNVFRIHAYSALLFTFLVVIFCRNNIFSMVYLALFLYSSRCGKWHTFRLARFSLFYLPLFSFPLFSSSPSCYLFLLSLTLSSPISPYLPSDFLSYFLVIFVTLLWQLLSVGHIGVCRHTICIASQNTPRYSEGAYTNFLPLFLNLLLSLSSPSFPLFPSLFLSSNVIPLFSHFSILFFHYFALSDHRRCDM